MADQRATVLIGGTASPEQSIEGLDLTILPERLNDETLAMVEAVAKTYPALQPCDERHFAQCLRVMQAVLPRQAADAMAGELFVETYRRHLARFPNEAISFLAERATATCRWFPTIAECLEILESAWRRNDPAIHRWIAARQLAERERTLREREGRFAELEAPALREPDLQTISPELRKIGLGAGWLVEDEDGALVWAERGRDDG